MTETLGHTKHFSMKLAILLCTLLIALLSLGSTAIAVPGAETREEAFAELAARQAAGEEMTDEELEALATARAAEAVAAVTAEGITPLQAMWIYLFEEAGADADEPRTTVTVTGAIDPYTPLPATVMFHFGNDYELSMLDQMNFDTGDSLGELEYTAGPSNLDDFENLTTYTFTLTEGHVFNAGFEIPLFLFDPDVAMGGSPLASFNFVPPNDLYGLVVAFVSPSPDLVGAGGQEPVQLIGETEEGELYAIIREDVPGGELQEYLIAFGSREARDAALAEAEAISVETTPTAMGNAIAWLNSPTGMIIAGSTLVLLIATVLIVVVLKRQRGEDATDGDDSDPADDSNSDSADNEPSDSDDDSSDESDADSDEEL